MMSSLLAAPLAAVAPEGIGASLVQAAPLLVLFFGALAIMLAEAYLRADDAGAAPPPRPVHLALALGSVAVSLVLVVASAGGEPTSAFSGALAVDAYGVFFNVLFLISGALAILLAPDYLRRISMPIGEYYALMLFGMVGMMLLANSNDLILTFVAIEIMSISFYVLCGMKRDDPRSVESAFKYFILGAFSSAIFLYGVAYVYGATGSTNLHVVAEHIAKHGDDAVLLTGLGMLLVGLGFKVAAVPFHMWAPDVYQGAPSTVTAAMATGVKAASFAALGRVLLVAFLGARADWWPALWVLSALTILVGNVAALAQNDLKRMLAYSSIAHAGYLLMALVGAGSELGLENLQASGLLFYLLAYTFMNLGAFAVVTLLVKDGDDATKLSNLAGLGRTNPWLAAGLSLCLLSLAGIPPTMGFVGKFYLFAAAIRGDFAGLAVVGAIGGAIGVYYYLRPIVLMYMGDDEAGEVVLRPGPAVSLVLGVSCAAILVFGLVPGLILPVCQLGLASLAG